MKTTEDRQRIEQAAISYTGGYNTERHDSYIGFVKGAEYATIYEREKQSELIKLLKSIRFACYSRDTDDEIIDTIKDRLTEGGFPYEIDD